LVEIPKDAPIKLLVKILPGADPDALRQTADRFRQLHPENGLIVLGSIVDDRPIVVAAVTDDLVKKGMHAGELVKAVALQLGGGGGGKATMAQAGGKDASKLVEALNQVENWVYSKLSKS
jgi:alanyl-tRNA synthetase